MLWVAVGEVYGWDFDCIRRLIRAEWGNAAKEIVSSKKPPCQAAP
jgi:hypothetical protein